MNEKKEIAAIAQSEVKETAKKYLNSLGQSLTAAETSMFLEISQAFGLNPFKREIYFVKYKDKASIITGYEVYLKRAEATGLLDGWSVDVQGDVPKMTATVTIWRKDRAHPFMHSAYYEESVKTTWNAQTRQPEPNSFWKSMPRTMLKKVAISQGFRLCFPEHLGGLPYTQDEIAADNEPIDVTHSEAEPAQKAQQQTEQTATPNPAYLRIVNMLKDPVFDEDYRNFCRELRKKGLPYEKIEDRVIEERQRRIDAQKAQQQTEQPARSAETSEVVAGKNILRSRLNEMKLKYGAPQECEAAEIAALPADIAAQVDPDEMKFEDDIPF